MGSFGQLQLSGSLTIQGIMLQVPNLIFNLIDGLPGSGPPVTLQAGENQILVPPTAQLCLIVLPPNNTIATTFQGVSGDTGTRIDPGGWMLIPFDSAAVPGSFYLKSLSTQTAPTAIYFY